MTDKLPFFYWGGGVVANVLDCKIIVSEFEFQSPYHFHFRIKTLGKGMNSIIPPAMS